MTKIAVCTRQRDIPKPCCGDYDAEKILTLLQQAFANVVAGACTNNCHRGVTIEVGSKIYVGVTPANIQKLIPLLRQDNSKSATNTNL